LKTSGNETPNILIVAAEASSSLYAQRLLEHWRDSDFKVQAFGIGSQAMEDLGFERIGKSEELAVVGLQEVIQHFPLIRRTFYQLIEEAEKRRPKVILLLDYPDFNLRLAKQLKKRGFKVVYYISPQIWAWRQGRVNFIRKWVDKMLVLFPFEKEFYAEHGVPVEFVGHPLLDEISDKYFSREYFDFHRSRYGIRPKDVVLALMPGSRNSELKHHLDLQLETAKKLAAENPTLKVAFLVAPTFSLPEIQARLPVTNFPLILVKDEPFEMIHLADVVLCASGTATLMVGLMRKPMVIMYRMKASTAWIAKRFVKSTAFFGMINLILNRRVVPELFQEQASVEGLCAELRPMLNSSEMRGRLAGELAEAEKRLGEKGATLRVAEALREYFEA
jgi:lipid-A-disaccharide synthase